MTGFARKKGQFHKDNIIIDWAWEIKSVNAKGLDIKYKLPQWLDRLGVELKAIGQKYFERGSISAFLEVNILHQENQIKINDSLLNQLTQKATEVFEQNSNFFQKPSIGELFKINGVIEHKQSSYDEELLELISPEIFTSFEDACKLLQKDRQNEGQKIKVILLDMINNIEAIVADIASDAQNLPNQLKSKLQQQLKELIDDDIKISEERLAQEVVLLVNKADIREELDRLDAHIASAKEIIESNQTFGRKFDFLCQELNREANTTCSKASNINIINYGIKLKALIEQLREQVQNME